MTDKTEAMDRLIEQDADLIDVPAMTDVETIGTQNGRLMAQYDCYTLASNPHTTGTKAHRDFADAFGSARDAICEHEFAGWRSMAGGQGGESFCQKCGLGAMQWSMRFLP